MSLTKGIEKLSLSTKLVGGFGAVLLLMICVTAFLVNALLGLETKKTALAVEVSAMAGLLRLFSVLKALAALLNGAISPSAARIPIQIFLSLLIIITS